MLDTAPTGHTLLLMDATGAYHRQMLRDLEPRLTGAGRVLTPLMRLQDPDLHPRDTGRITRDDAGVGSRRAARGFTAGTR